MALDKKGKSTYGLGHNLKMIINWPITVWAVFAGLVVCMLILVPWSVFSVIMLSVFGIYSIFALVLLFITRKKLKRELIGFASSYSHMQQELLFNVSIPYCILDTSGKVLWMNKNMHAITHTSGDYNQNIAILFEELTPNKFPMEKGGKTEIRFSFEEKDYKADIKRVDIGNEAGDFSNITKIKSIPIPEMSFIAVGLEDITEINAYIRKIHDKQLAVAVIDIDNYEDSIENIAESRKSFVVGIIDKYIYDYFEKVNAFVKKIDEDRFIAAFTYDALDEFTKDQFSILEKVKSVDIGKGVIQPTLSIGIGAGAEKYNETHDKAKAALFLALGRGGDQAVIKDGEKVSYFGGKVQMMEKNTRVKIRVKAQAMRQIIEVNDNVIVMGHQNPDIDSFGAAVGIYEVARHLGKKAYIVLNEVTPGIKPFYDRFEGREGYEDGVFINSEEAMRMSGENTVAIVVDVNDPSRVECPKLLEKEAISIVVFDHHRVCERQISNADLSYVDTFASSTCEMVTEMIQYMDIDIKLMGFEADALYGGIVIDTDGFKSKAGPRTFEAAAFLRRHGTDVVRVRKLLRDDIDEYKAVTDAVTNAEMFRDGFMISIYNCENSETSPTVGASKTANQLMNIKGVKAAFVLTMYKGAVNISARSLDEINVQLVMEKMGGGGHLSIAGAQIKDATLDEVKERLKQVIDEMINNKEI